MRNDPRTIERVALTHVDDVEARLRGEVLTAAADMFGYQAGGFRAAGPLATALARLDIAPLDEDAVRGYMRSKEWRKRWSARGRWWRACGLALPVVLSAAVLVTHRVTHDAFAGFVAACLTLIAWVFISGMAADFMFSDDTVEERAFWREYSLGSSSTMDAYRRYVPVHVLNLAVQVRRELRSAEFRVHELASVVRRVERPRPDPFLEVKLGAEHYFLAVWDERDYEERR